MKSKVVHKCNIYKMYEMQLAKMVEAEQSMS